VFEKQLVFCADTPILAFALGLGGAVILENPLCYYRLHARNMCAHDPSDIARNHERRQFHDMTSGIQGHRFGGAFCYGRKV